MNKRSVLERIRGGLIVSCQAVEGEPLHGADTMAKMALAAKMGGAVGIRANGAEDIRRIKACTELPVIGIVKRVYEDSEVYITSTLREVEEVVEAGADIVAVDATMRRRPGNLSTSAFLERVKREFPDIVLMADISTLEEGIMAEQSGADVVASTMAGYTAYSRPSAGPDLALVANLVNTLTVSVVAEGRIRRPEEAKACIELGCWAVVVGSAITRPQDITRDFVEEIRKAISR
jgi:putative N-acetylmannosamine-6-phosphate epimerase